MSFLLEIVEVFFGVTIFFFYSTEKKALVKFFFFLPFLVSFYDQFLFDSSVKQAVLYGPFQKHFSSERRNAFSLIRKKLGRELLYRAYFK